MVQGRIFFNTIRLTANPTTCQLPRSVFIKWLLWTNWKMTMTIRYS